MAKLGWYGRRLRSMEKRELLWRAGQALLALGSRERHPAAIIALDGAALHAEIALEQFRTGADRPVLLDRRRAEVIMDRVPGLVDQLLDSADLASECSFRFFGYPAVSLKQPIDWHHDPIADLRWPDLPSHRIDHRDASGDVKWIWELNRLQHLPWLAQAWLFTGDNRYSQAAFGQLDTWIDQNQPGRGIAWRGAFEAGIRAVSIAVALQGLRDSPELTVERYRRIVGVLAQSAFRCWSGRSRFSSANNHLIGEMAGLAIVSMMFPEILAASDWEQRAIESLSAEARKQILPDGSGAEQSVGYQMATVELLHLVGALMVQRDGRAPSAITDAITRSSAFLASVVGQHDPDPRYGDNDEEFALRLGPERVRTVRDHLGIVAASGWSAAGADVGSDSVGAQWYRSIAKPVPSALSTQASAGEPGTGPAGFFARDGGLVVLRGQRRRTTIDVGPLGYLSIAAHGHADALAITLSEDGEDLIGDPGTGSYYRHPHLRSVMRGTRAHSTVCIDGQDQSVIGGPFLWSRHAHTRVGGVDLLAGVVDAEHDGYTRLRGRVVHRRWLIAPPVDRAQLVIDLITGDGTHEVRTSWPLHPSLDVHRIQGGHALSRRQLPVLQLLHAATGPLTCDDVHGDAVRDLGWWSDRFESRVPAWWLSAVCNAEPPLVIATLITPMDGVSTVGLAVALQNREIQATWTEDTRVRSIAIQTDGVAAVAHRTMSKKQQS
jgi:hypothetical protein